MSKYKVTREWEVEARTPTEAINKAKKGQHDKLLVVREEDKGVSISDVEDFDTKELILEKEKINRELEWRGIKLK